MGHVKRSRALLTVILVTAGVAAASSHATTLGRNGLIAYGQEVGHGYQLFTIRPDGTGITQITHLKSDARFPDWSPNGKLITFTYETPPAFGSVALISPRGTGLREVTPVAPGSQSKRDWNGSAVFAPDGKSLVFGRNQAADSGIWIMRTDGSGLRRLTRNPFVRNWNEGDIAPSVSPDGQLVSFVRVRQQKPALLALFTVRIDGTASSS